MIPIDNILFASEMVGAVRGIDPETGHYFDDTKRYIDGNAKLTAADRAKDLRGQRPQGLPPPRRASLTAIRTPAIWGQCQT